MAGNNTENPLTHSQELVGVIKFTNGLPSPPYTTITAISTNATVTSAAATAAIIPAVALLCMAAVASSDSEGILR
ncbi:hypothetical protein E2C01_043329 [Portunus trituberculatus]|uniref:Uncharacterized protein n=1 Tax=Portunus trituberculatus TaxID=210409 RepID=A0A5B7FVF7_PORTR|nr:hypothetical protein [Portunus trituberculatus]